MVEIINECLSGLNHLGGAFSHYAVRAFLQSAALVIVLFVIDLFLRKRVRAVFRYCIWLLVLVKLILPPTLSLPTGIGYWVGHRLPVASPVSEHLVDAGGSEPVGRRLPPRPQPSSAVPPVQPAANSAVEPDVAAPPAASTLTPITWQAILLLFWLAGTLAFAALLAQRVRFVRGLVAASTLAEGELLGLLEECRRQIGVRGQVGLRTSDAVPSPAVCGLVRPTVLMPASLVAKLPPDGLKATLIHELAHIKRGDLWINSVQTFLQVVYFYNPFVWLANAIIRRTCEEAVDETVLVTLGGRAKDYSNTLIDIGEMAFWKADFGLRLIGVAESRKALQGRIKHMLTSPVPKNARIGVLGTIVILVIAAVLLPMARAERSDKEAPVAPPTPVAGSAEKTTASPGENDTIVDPNSGLRFVATQTIAGANDVIDDESWTTLSPNGKFLLDLWEGRIVPLDGSPAFVLNELRGPDVDTWSAAWSPDGQKIAFHAEGIQVLPVSPDTGRATGPVRKLLDEKDRWFRGRIYWSADSERILFAKKKNDVEWEAARSITLRDGRLNQEPDYADFGLVSPDANTIAYSIPNDGIWTRPVNGGAARILRARSRGWVEDAELWTADNQWIVSVVDGWGWRNVHFTRLSDRRNFDLFPPQGVGTFVGKSTDGRKLYFYRSSFDPAPTTFKVVPVAGGPVTSLRATGSWEETWDYWWTPDSASLATLAYGWVGPQQAWFIPLDKADRVQFNVASLEKEHPWLWGFSPGRGKLLYAIRRGTDQGMQSVDLCVAPVSLENGRAIGAATLVFEGLRSPHPEISKFASAWSPDGTRIAMPVWDGRRTGLWIVSTDGSKAVQIVAAPDEVGNIFMWSPDSRMIAFGVVTADRKMLRVIPAEGGTIRTVMTTPKEQSVAFAWSPDSKEVVAAFDGAITSIPVTGGTGRAIVRLQEAGYDHVSWLRWSPDGQHLAFYAERGGEDSRLCLFSPDSGHITTLDNSPSNAGDFLWSPDSKMICCTVSEAIKTRPAGILRELDVAKVLEKEPPLAEEKRAEVQPTPRAEPIVGPVFSDNFDNGLSKYWSIVNSTTETSPPATHAVENGQLTLSNSSARLYQIDWTDYIVTVRVCMKESVTSGQGTFGIQMRTTPSGFGIKNMDRYTLVMTCVDGLPTGLYLGINYRDASNTGHNSRLAWADCTLVRDKWYTLEFEVRGQHLRGFLDGKLMVEATDARLSKGGIWLGAWRSCALFDDFSVRQLP
jgi:beta-lactamase regulating signal transducer with metallopeptidase domain/Tol biopolymer transport system component